MRTLNLSPATFSTTERTLSVVVVEVTNTLESAVIAVVSISTSVWPAATVAVPSDAWFLPSGPPAGGAAGVAMVYFIFPAS